MPRKSILVFFISIALILGPNGMATFAQIGSTPTSDTSTAHNITVDFKDADIHTVLRVLSLKSGVNIVAAKDVRGAVTVRLVDVPWDVALETILSTYDYAYERVGNVITVNNVTKMTEQKKAQRELFEVQPLLTEVFALKYLNAVDMIDIIEPMLSGRGQAAVLYSTGQRGWGISGISGLGVPTGEDTADTQVTTVTGEDETRRFSKTLVVIDIPPYIERVRRTIETIDVMPKQVLIEARIVEVRHDDLKDLGIDVTSGSFANFALNPVTGNKGSIPRTMGEAGGASLSAYATPFPFDPQSTEIEGVPNIDQIFETGLSLVYRKLTGFQFEAMIHALEEDIHANILSAPHIRTLDNQEASILVGEKYPILSGEAGSGETATATAELDYYQDIGIQLRVTPQINAEGHVSMIVHPTISTQTGVVQAGVSEAAVPIQYPILSVREAETQIIMQDGETIMIGGLLRDSITHGRQGIPFLKDIPLFGLIFGRDTTDVEKIDLLIFITAHIIDDNLTAERSRLRYEEFKEIDKDYLEKQRRKEQERKKIEADKQKRAARKKKPTLER